MLFTDLYVSEMARYIKSPTAQRAIWKLDAGTPIGFITSNPNLAPSLWDEIYDALGDEPYARARLFLVAPTAQQARRILTEPDKGLALSIIAAGIKNLTPSLIKELLAAPFFDESFAHSLIEGKQISKKTARYLWENYLKDNFQVLDSAASISFDLLLTHYNIMGQEEIMETLGNWMYNDYLLAKAIDMHPAVIGLISKIATAQWRSDYYPSLARSRHLPKAFADEIFEYLLEKSTVNPNNLELGDIDSLGYLASNPWLPGELRLRACNLLLELPDGRSGVLVGTLAHRNYLELHKALTDDPNKPPLLNPTAKQLAAGADNFTPEQLDGLYNAVIDSGGWNYPSLHAILELAYHGYDLLDAPSQEQEDPPLYELTDECLAPTLDPLGIPGWQLFLSLLPGWRGSVKDLLQVAISTAQL